MEMNDLEVRRIYMSYVSSKVRTSRKECPSIKELRDAFEAKTYRSAKNRVVDHISECAHCAEDFQFIHGIRTRERDLAEEIRAIARNRRPSFLYAQRPLWNYVIGTSLIAIVIAAVFMFRGAPPPDGGRNRPAIMPEILAPTGPIAADPPLLFKWRPVAGAASYVIEVYDESLQFIWESPPVSTTAAILPAHLWQVLSDGSDYYWSVTAYDSEGKIGESRFEVFSFDH